MKELKEILDLVKEKNFINGKFISSQHKIDVLNPASLELIGYAAEASEEEIISAIDSAENSFKTWSKINFRERKSILLNWYNKIIEYKEILAEIITLENGKALEDARKEVLYGANFVSWFASQISNISGNITNGILPDQKIIMEYEPVGIVGAITPWNFPSAMITRKISPALAAGCTIILKPSELTPYSALALCFLAKVAGIADGVINVITSVPARVSDIFERDSRIRKISFTGSTKIGKLLYKKSAQTVKKLSLELGGNSPFIICHDANIEKSVNSLISAKLRSSGQSCTSPNRIFIHESIYEEVINLLKEKISKLLVGDGLCKNSTIGPLINRASLEKIERLIADAESIGAKILLGGEKSKFYLDKNGEKISTRSEHNFFDPTLIIDCSEEMNLFEEEIFGPVIACYKFKNYEEVIKLANKTIYGLASYIFSENINLCNKLSDELDYGMVGINESIVSNEIGAFSGRKESGFGIEGSLKGIYEYLNPKYKCITYSRD